MSKNLVLYFSVYGTAKRVAEEIARQTGADIQEIVPMVPYDSDRNHYNALARLAKREHDEDMRPAIKNPIHLDGYDNIFIGYPMWSTGDKSDSVPSLSFGWRRYVFVGRSVRL